jgi:hypothetical protein
MEIIINYWYIILAVIAVLVATAVAAYRYLGLPREEQLAKVREWLLWAVTGAEKELGGGTGKLKLRQVYDLFVMRFPWLVRVVSFDLFSDMVDDALEEMRSMLQTNTAVKVLVKGGDGNGNAADA